MSQVLQCTQFCALICNRFPPGPGVLGRSRETPGRTMAAIPDEIVGPMVDLNAPSTGHAAMAMRRLVLLVVGIGDKDRG